MARKRNVKKILFLSVLILIAGGFFANWFLTYRLQDFLRKQMSERVSKATDGFYTLSFDKLSVGLFNGELKIEGLDIRPDSMAFERLSKVDSLPDVYFKINVQSIDFKGLNLTWMLNYRKLHFDLFEIKSPIVDLNSLYPIKEADEGKAIDQKEQNLYAMVSPFFDVVSVRYLNFENAIVSYSVAGDPVPSVYALRDVSFHASGFRLDKNSSKNGKLLYCDNFDFTTNKKQQLLLNSEFELNTDYIRLNTEDSIVQIEGIELLPQKHLWRTAHNMPSSFVDARIRDISLEGLAFKRKDAKNYLTARLFNIASSDIEYVKIDTILQEKIKAKNKATVSRSWSLYAILSPILNSTTIDSIAVEETKFRFVTVSEKGKDEYILNDFDFWATNFLVDAQSAASPSLLYSDNFGFNAENLTGDMPSRNHRMNIRKVQLDTQKKLFRVKGVDLSPIETQGRYDYMRGTIDSISIDGLSSEEGIDANNLLIESPNIEYTINPYFKKKKKRIALNVVEEEADEDLDVSGRVTSIDMIAGITKHYYVKNIDLRNANFTYKVMRKGGVDTFKVNNFSFFAKDFLVNDYTRRNIDWYFTCSDLGFNLKNFDNYIMDRKYWLSAKDIVFTGLKGRLSLKDVQLIPQENTWTEAPPQYIKFVSPLVEALGVDWDERKVINVTSLKIETPDIQLIKSYAKASLDGGAKQKKSSLLPEFITAIQLGSLGINKTNFSFVDKPKQAILNTSFSNLNLKELVWDIAKTATVSVDEIILDKPSVNYKAGKSGNSTPKAMYSNEQTSDILSALKINGLIVNDAAVNIDVPNNKSSLDLRSFSFKGLDWSLSASNNYFRLKDIDVAEPELQMFIYAQKSEVPSAKKESKDIYSSLGGLSEIILIDNLNLKNANVDYNYLGAGVDSVKQKLYDVNLSLNKLAFDSKKKSLLFDDIGFSTKNLSFPIDKGFYTVSIDYVNLLKRGEKLELNNVRMRSPYPKMEFAYRHTENKDWFDVSVGNVTVKGIDVPKFLSDKILNINDVQIVDVDLKNYKNQKIVTPQRISPIIYEKLLKLPVKFSVNNMNVNNFAVTYDELAKNAKEPGVIFFTEMNGHFTGLTNIVNQPEQYINLDVDGKFMGTGYFTATWKIPVDTNNDRFILNGHLHKFDLTELNQLIFPMANASVVSGTAQDTKFNMDASSVGGRINLSFLYNDLKISLMKEKDSVLVEDKLVTTLANWVIRDNNPNNPKGKPRTVDIYVERNPYRSTFNYLWQMLQPSLAESAGVSYRTQKFLKDLPKIPEKIRDFFWKEGSYTKSKDKK